MSTLSANPLATADGFTIAWYELGGGDGQPPIILQHGFSVSTEDEWVSCGIAASLEKLGRRIIGIDALGHGRSDKPHESRHYGEARMARDISALATHLGLEQFDLVGYSMGAVVAALAGTFEPRLRRLAIGGVGESVATLGGVDTRVLRSKTLAEVLVADDPSSFPEAVRAFRTGAEARGADLRALAAQAAVVNATPIRLDLIKARTLVLAGDADPLAVNPALLAAAIPGARLVMVPGDHTGARLSSEFTAALLDFLA